VQALAGAEVGKKTVQRLGQSPAEAEVSAKVEVSVAEEVKEKGRKKKRKARYSSSESSEGRDRKRRQRDSSSEDDNKKSTSGAIDVATASISQLKAMCVKHGVLSTGFVEKADFIKALAPFTGVQPKQHMPGTGAQPQANRPPRVSKFDMKEAPPPKEAKIAGLNIPVPSQQAPVAPASTSFTKASLQAMSSKELRTMCVQFKVLPPGPVERSELLQALSPLASG